MIFLFLNKYTQLAKQKLVRKGWNQHQRRSAFSHFHTEPLPHFELPRWQEINSATTEWIYAERTTSSLHVSVILSGAAWKQPKSNRPGRMPGTPVIPPQQRSCLKRGATQHFIRVVCTIDSVCVAVSGFTLILALQFLMQVVLLSREGVGGSWTPLVSWTVLIRAPWGPWQKRQVGITVCSFVAGGASEAGSGLRPQSLLPSPQQASCLFALEVVLSQVTVKVAGSQDDILQFNYQLGMAVTERHNLHTSTCTLYKNTSMTENLICTCISVQMQFQQCSAATCYITLMLETGYILIF